MLAALALPACEADAGPTPEGESSPRPTPTDRTLEFGVFGSEEELDAYASLVDVYNSLYDGAEMTMTGYGSREELMGEIRETGEVPDVFLTDQRDLAWLQQSEQPAAGRLDADRARRRLRRPLLPRRGARLQRRLPAAVHAGRHLADW